MLFFQSFSPLSLGRLPRLRRCSIWRIETSSIEIGGKFSQLFFTLLHSLDLPIFLEERLQGLRGGSPREPDHSSSHSPWPTRPSCRGATRQQSVMLQQPSGQICRNPAVALGTISRGEQVTAIGVLVFSPCCPQSFRHLISALSIPQYDITLDSPEYRGDRTLLTGPIDGPELVKRILGHKFCSALIQIGATRMSHAFACCGESLPTVGVRKLHAHKMIPSVK